MDTNAGETYSSALFCAYSLALWHTASGKQYRATCENRSCLAFFSRSTFATTANPTRPHSALCTARSANCAWNPRRMSRSLNRPCVEAKKQCMTKKNSTVPEDDVVTAVMPSSPDAPAGASKKPDSAPDGDAPASASFRGA